VRVAPDPVIPAVAQLDQLEHLLDPVAAARLVVVGEQPKVAPSAQIRVEAGRLDEAGDSVEGAGALLERLSTLPEADEVAGSGDWVERLSQWQRLLTTIGLGIGVVLAAAAFLTVTTATTLILHARRAETEIMRLVGATETTIWLPLLLQGTMQGLIGAVLALAALVATHSVVAPRLEPLVNLTLGLPDLAFLPPVSVLALVLTGALLGGMGGWLVRPGREP